MSATYAQFLSDPARVSVWLAEITYYDPALETTGIYYYSTDCYGTGAGDSLVSQLYSPRLMNGYDFAAMTAAIGPFGGMLPAREGGALVLAQKMGDLDGHRLLSFDGRSVVIRHGGWSPVYGWVAYADFAVVFNGEAQGAALVGIDTVTIQLRNLDARLEHPIQDRRYTGGTYWLYFDGSDYVDCGATAAATSHLNFTSGDFTVEFFIYLDATPGSDMRIASRGLLVTDGWYVYVNSSRRIGFTTSQAGVSQISTSTAIPLGKRVHVAVVRDGAVCSIYLDGVLSMNSSATHVDPLTASRIFTIGSTEAHGSLLIGFLDEIRIWGSARSRGLINSLKDRQLQATEIVADLLFYAKCDDGTGTTLDDASASNVTCTITGATWYPSLQGGEELEGSPLPDVWGQRHGYVPVLVDEARLIYQVHSGSVYETTQVLVGGVVIGYDPAPGTTYTSMSAFLAASTAPGCYERLVTEYGTWIRLKTAPNFPVTMTVKGDNTGGSGYGGASTYRSSAAYIVRYIICNRGPQPLTDPTDLDAASFATLEADQPCIVGDAYADGRTIADVVGYLLASIGAVGWFDRSTGDFTVYRFNGTAAKVATLDLTEKDVAEGTLEVLDAGPPAWGIDLYWKKNDLVHSSTDIAQSVINADPPPTTNWRFLMLEWRRTAPRDASVRIGYKGAVVHELQTAIQTYTDAAAEAARLLALYSTPGQCFRAFFRERATQLDRMDFVTFSFQDLDQYGDVQQRLGTATDAMFIVLAVEDEVENGGTWLTLYREAVT